MTTSPTPARYDVAALGNAIVDILARAADDDLSHMALAKGHMALVDAAQAKDLYAQMGAAVEMSGGSAANTAVGVASLGGSAAFFGRVAGDKFGEIFRHDIEAAHVAFRSPADSDAELPTGQCLVFVTPDGERTMCTSLGIAPQLSVEQLEEETIAAAQVTYLEGYLHDAPVAIAALTKAAQIAHAHGRHVALTLSDAFCVDRHRDAFKAFISAHVDLLFANEAEITFLAQMDDVLAASRAIAPHCTQLIVTRGPMGALLVNGEGTVEEVPVERPVEVVDTTGAGDLFAAGYLFGHARNMAPRDAARLAHLCAGEIIGGLGARPQRILKTLAAEHGLVDASA
ncbi:MAG: adenosine kinase [Pseudomonadota bacterium]